MQIKHYDPQRNGLTLGQSTQQQQRGENYEINYGRVPIFFDVVVWYRKRRTSEATDNATSFKYYF